MTRRKRGLFVAFVLSVFGACAGDGLVPMADDASDPETEPTDVEENVAEAGASCTPSATTYSPYTGDSPSGELTRYPWRGFATTYPAGVEDFRGYSSAATIECSSSKTSRSHLDVTAGCLKAVAIGAEPRARIVSTSGGAFRAIALGFAPDSSAPLLWTDQSVEYRFYYQRTSGPGIDPGFKAFARYRTENDLYVGSWRVDGVVQIKKKICGVYTTLAETRRSGPSRGAWHRIRFDVAGTSLALYLDDELVLSATDATLTSGTAGIRTDAMTGAYLDDWRVQAPM